MAETPTGFVIRDFMKILLTTISSKIPIFDADDAGLEKKSIASVVVFYCCCFVYDNVELSTDRKLS